MHSQLFEPEWVKEYMTKTARLSDCVEYQEFSWKSEKGCMYLCRLWPGLTVWVNRVELHSLPCEAHTDYPFLKLNYCTAGRCETLLENGRYVYLESGDLSIDHNVPKDSFRYPSGEYEGLEIVLNMALLKEQPVPALKDFGIIPALQRWLEHTDRGSFFARVSLEWDSLAQTLMKRLKAADGRIEDYRFLTIQLMYQLNTGNAVTRKRSAYVTRGQRMIAEKTSERLCRDFRNHPAIEDLAAEFGISASSLKKYFIQVYGCPVSEYVHEARMEYACRLLTDTRMSIGEIAADTGYIHQGKFGSAFKKHTGDAPLEYRRKNTIKKQGGDPSCKS